MRKVVAALLAGTSIFISATAFAQSEVATVDVQPVADDSGSNDIVVIGKGETRQVQELSQQDLAELTPRHQPAQGDREASGRQFPGRRSVRFL